ncbi:AEC family transporter [Polymorphum gilvum]|uniref:Malonate transporter protein n=1 Tax=Polymorphum gilvum (strain LMG 25793 / CGMCC 1.9160 / SL003B-26A1) TaxID=991905 RepID=F2IZU0_POLGS|nr:AEC family transporter [Polymorphum gilvum]ADZ70666.1 Malonate transporter protein [Polymorphum gilvum SL003B-26A1]
MQDVISLAFPFFGLIFLGFAAGKIRKIPAAGMEWMNFFIIYIALPALFFRLLSETPIEQLTDLTYVATTTFTTYTVFAISFCIGVLATRGAIPESTILAFAGSYSNIGYMGPGLTLAVLGPAATVPTAFVLCFDNTLMFILAPLMMAIGGTDRKPLLETIRTAVLRVILHPFILATIAGIFAAAIEFEPPEGIATMLRFLSNAAAPCALFAMGVTVAQRPVGKIPVELPAILVVKLIVHPVLVYLMLRWIGGFDPVWVATAVLMACLPPATNVFVIAQQYQVYMSRASTFVMIGTMASVVTVTGFIWAITHGYLPAG